MELTRGRAVGSSRGSFDTNGRELMAHQKKRSAAAKKKMGTPNKSTTKHTYSKPKAKKKAY